MRFTVSRRSEAVVELSSEQTQEALRVDLVTGLKRSGVRGHSEATGNWKVELLCGSLRGSHLCSVGRFIFGRQEKKEKERRGQKTKKTRLLFHESTLISRVYTASPSGSHGTPHH